MNSRNLFYVRNLQAKFYFKKNEIVRSLFFLENYLFSLPKQTEEILVVKLRVKWIYDQIKVDNFTNELTTNFIVFKDSILKEKILTFIDYFSQTLEEKKIENIFKTFKKLNKEFNSIISFSGSDFRSSVYFQIFQYMYKEDFKNRNELQNFFSNSRLQINDHFEEVFIKTFLKFFLKKKKKKISKTIYLFYLLICFFNKNESNSP